VTLRERLGRLPPALSRTPLLDLWRAARERSPGQALRRQLSHRLGGAHVALHGSGRDALRAVLVEAAQATGRKEVLVPAYTCFSVPAACVAAELQVRLLDLDERGRVPADQLGDGDWHGAAACLVDNLFGIASALGPLSARARTSGTWLIDDAAQALGAETPEGKVGNRGDAGVLSFGRGKPLSGLGGGARVRRSAPFAQEPALPEPAVVSAQLRWAAYALASRQPVFGLLASVPALGIGETVYDPGFARGGIDGAAALLTLAALSRFDAQTRARRARAHAIAAHLAERGSAFEPLLEPAGTLGVYPRLALLAPDGRQRDAALARLHACGASAMYPTPLGAIPGLAPHLVGDTRCPGAERFCARLLTLPTHAGIGAAQLEKIAGALV
jgi:dTDP-4-amino-4,6-dideoxygalactose transaminase